MLPTGWLALRLRAPRASRTGEVDSSKTTGSRHGILGGMSARPSVAERVVGAIARTKRIDADRIRPETTFEELGVDSLDAIELLFEIEEEFDLTVDDDAVQGKENVGQVIEAVEEALAEKAAGGPPAGKE